MATPPVTLEWLYQLLNDRAHSGEFYSENPYYQGSSNGMITEYPEGTNIYAPLMGNPKRLFPPEQEMRMEEPGVIYSQGSDSGMNFEFLREFIRQKLGI